MLRVSLYLKVTPENHVEILQALGTMQQSNGDAILVIDLAPEIDALSCCVASWSCSSPTCQMSTMMQPITLLEILQGLLLDVCSSCGCFTVQESAKLVLQEQKVLLRRA